MCNTTGYCHWGCEAHKRRKNKEYSFDNSFVQSVTLFEKEYLHLLNASKNMTNDEELGSQALHNLFCKMVVQRKNKVKSAGFPFLLYLLKQEIKRLMISPRRTLENHASLTDISCEDGDNENRSYNVYNNIPDSQDIEKEVGMKLEIEKIKANISEYNFFLINEAAKVGVGDTRPKHYFLHRKTVASGNKSRFTIIGEEINKSANTAKAAVYNACKKASQVNRGGIVK